MIIAILTTMFTGIPAFAATDTNETLAANARTDEYALDYFKNKWLFNNPNNDEIVALAKTITSGIKSDYAKVKAIHKWVANNIWYDVDALGNGALAAIGPVEVIKHKRTNCVGFANLTIALAQVAGFPAKSISGWSLGIGGRNNHRWAEVYVDGRWVFTDASSDTNNGYMGGIFYPQRSCTTAYFDASVTQYSKTHKIDDVSYKQLDANAWNGSLYFADTTNNYAVLKEVPKFPFNGYVNSTYGFNANELYLDKECTIPYTPNTKQVDSLNCVIYVKPVAKPEPKPEPLPTTVTASPTPSKV